jgi:DNA-binding transcriptional MerR regulator
MRIGELSKRTGASVQAIRLYERRRLLKKPLRTPAGYRVYSEDYVDVVRLIHQGKQFGFTLNEIRGILALFAVPDDATGTTRYQPGEHACVVEILRIGAKKLESLDSQIASLRRKRSELRVALHELATPKRRGRKTTLRLRAD